MTVVDGGPVARMRVVNRGATMLELILEPYASDHWLRPGETFVRSTAPTAARRPARRRSYDPR